MFEAIKAKLAEASDEEVKKRYRALTIALFAMVGGDAVASMVLYKMVPQHVWICIFFLPGVLFIYLFYSLHKAEYERRNSIRRP